MRFIIYVLNFLLFTCQNAERKDRIFTKRQRRIRRDLLSWNRNSNTFQRVSGHKAIQSVDATETTIDKVKNYLSQIRNFYRLKNDDISLHLLNQIATYQKTKTKK